MTSLVLWIVTIIVAFFAGFATGFFVYNNNKEKSSAIAEDIKETVESTKNE